MFSTSEGCDIAVRQELLAGLAFAFAISSCTVLEPSAALTVTSDVLLAATDTAAKSRNAL